MGVVSGAGFAIGIGAGLRMVGRGGVGRCSGDGGPGEMTEHILSLLLATPLVGVLLLVVLNRSLARMVAVASTLGTMALSLFLWRSFDHAASGFQFVERVDWVPALGIHYSLGVDGISLLLVLLSTVIVFLAVLAS